MSNRARSERRPERRGPAWVFAPPSMDDLIRLLGAWRLWILGGLLAAVLGAVAHSVAPPPYRARATVNVDFHMEQAWPQNTDREQFYYLERETRKLVEIAHSDEVLQAVARAVPGITLQRLRAGAGQLSQPGSGGWHFFGIDRDPQLAALIASTWARAFVREVSLQVNAAQDDGPERFITADLVQVESLDPERSVGVGTYMLASVVVVLCMVALGLLLVHPTE